MVLALASGKGIGMFPRKLETVGVVVAALGIATLTAGWGTHGPAMSGAKASPAADPPKPGERPTAKVEEKKVAWVVGVEGLAAALDSNVEIPGTDGPDPRLTLDEQLDLISIASRVPLVLNEKAFEADGVESIAKAPVAARGAMPKMKAPLGVVLRKVLSRVEHKSGAAFLVRNDRIEVTTEAAALREIGFPAATSLLPLVYQGSKPVSLDKAIAAFADSSGFNVILDPRAAEKGKSVVSICLNNVPIDTALRVLADTAGLAVVRMDNVFYVTFPDNAKKLVTEMPPTKPHERLAIPVNAP